MIPVPARRALAVLPVFLGLAGCGLVRPMSAEDRETTAACTADADRVYAARNRYQMSERDQTGLPYAGNALPSDPTAGLSDKYEQEQMIDGCVARNGAGANSGPAAPPQK